MKRTATALCFAAAFGFATLGAQTTTTPQRTTNDKSGSCRSSKGVGTQMMIASGSFRRAKSVVASKRSCAKSSFTSDDGICLM